jgi:hypothetical protein
MMIKMKELLKYIPYLFACIAAWFIYNFFFKKGVSTILDDTAKEQGFEGLRNGMTYAQAADTLYNSMFSGSFAGTLFFNADEESIGNLLLSIYADEFRKLETVYNAVKKERNPWITIARGGTLADDLRSVFSSKEQTKYMSHLLLL